MKFNILIASVLLVMSSCSKSDDDKDMTKPIIVTEGYEAEPSDCQIFRRGEKISFHYVFSDNVELGAYNIEIHNNFDHHTHSTSNVECELSENKTPVSPWIYNKDFEIPQGKTDYDASFDIEVPDNIDEGDYHFMIRLTDKEGWQEIKSVAIKVIE